jgi:hypothetical protein
MSDVSRPNNSGVDSFLPVPYVTQYTNRTPTIGPLLLTVVKAWAVFMVEWGSLRWVDHAPVIVWIVSGVVALLVLGVIERREWLNFKNRRYFPTSLAGLMAAWACVVGYAYYLDLTTTHVVEPETVRLQGQIASANRERDVAVMERDAARREHDASGAAPLPPISQLPPMPTMNAGDAEARIDVWKSIEGQMNDFNRILEEGDAIVQHPEQTQAVMSARASDFRQHLTVTRNRLGQLIGTYPDYSDLKVVDQQVPTRLSAAIENLLQTASQMAPSTPPSEVAANLGSYIRSLKRELAPVKQWAAAVTAVSESSIAELTTHVDK